MPGDSLLSYYRENQFNPVPIALDTPEAWQSHVAKRRNLYQHHLGIPLGLLAGKSVLEFGCNSGENALVFAALGASLTLVEPNEQVLPRLRELFQRYDLESRITALHNTDVDGFQAAGTYDVVLAEGFLYTLDNRDEMLKKICEWIKPGGIGVISFNDRYGFLVEYIKQLVLRRACELSDIDLDSEVSLELAQRLFGEDFARISASRPFAAWWKDTLVNPFLAFDYLWSYEEILPLIAAAGCEAYHTSPVWNTAEHFNWYKNARSAAARHELMLESHAALLPFILIGLPPEPGNFRKAPQGDENNDLTPASLTLGSPSPYMERGSGGEVRHAIFRGASRELVRAIYAFMQSISAYVYNLPERIESVQYPPLLDAFLAEGGDARLIQFNSEAIRLFHALHTANDPDSVIAAYRDMSYLRTLWGTPYHYLSFIKSPDDTI